MNDNEKPEDRGGAELDDNDVRLLALGLMLILVGLAYFFDIIPAAAQYGGPPMWDRGPNPEYRARRFIPERSYDPYDRGPEERYDRRRQAPMGREEYERRVFCSRNPGAC